MSKHTPGPWQISKSNNEKLSTVEIGTEDRYITLLSWTKDIAEEQKANARLIASAPELLEAAEKVIQNGMACSHDEVKARVELRQVIEKAKGEGENE